MYTEDESRQISKLAAQAIGLAKDNLLIHLRFLDRALAKLETAERWGLEGLATDTQTLYYDPLYVLRLYKKAPAALARACLHSLLHCIFSHAYGYEKMDTQRWDLAADIAVEAVILELDLESVTLENDVELPGKLKVLRQDAGGLTADILYRYFKRTDLPKQTIADYQKSFAKDLHTYWKAQERIEMTEEEWQQISRRIRAELKSFSESRGMGETLKESLDESTRERYDYHSILQRFMVMGERMGINEEEYDYIYYTYGLNTYGNLPLVEPLEYREEKRVREFVIAIDTSASCSGAIVKGFLRRTFEMLKEGESFFEKINIHILQCDSEIRSDVKLTNREELEAYLVDISLRGFGGTDFRPVFAYVEELQERGEFENLKGLIYFTDGFGIYPALQPPYDVIFAFLNEDRTRGPVPPWSMKVVLEEEDLEEKTEKADTTFAISDES